MNDPVKQSFEKMVDEILEALGPSPLAVQIQVDLACQALDNGHAMAVLPDGILIELDYRAP